MEAVVLTENGRLEQTQREVPTCGRDEYLIEVNSVGVCNSDIFRGFSHGAYHYPLVMGHEFSGMVVERGEECQKYPIGQAVAIFPLIPCFKCKACENKQWVHCKSYDYYGSRRDGGYQRFITIKEWNLLPIPEGVDPVLACLCEPVAVCLRTAGMLPAHGNGGKTAIIGAGILGITTAMILKDRPGYEEVVVVDRNPFKLDMLRDFGLNGILFDEHEAHQGTFHHVIEASGATSTYHASLGLAAGGAVVVWMGNIQSDITFSKKEISSILRKELTIKGTWNSDYQHGVNDDWGAALELIREAKWLPRLITHQIRLTDLPEVLEKLHQVKVNHTPHNFLKVVVNVKTS